jgi:sensor domain CHASE-containing protein
MNPSEEELRDAIARMEAKRNAAAYQLRKLHKWLDTQPDFIQKRWEKEQRERTE